MKTEMDVLVIENCLLFKEEQQPWEENSDWKTELVLD
jgi:carbamoyltransferase